MTKPQHYAVSDCSREAALSGTLILEKGKFLPDGRFQANSDGLLWQHAVPVDDFYQEIKTKTEKTMIKVTCLCGEEIELTQKDIKYFCAVECPRCGTDVEYDVDPEESHHS